MSDQPTTPVQNKTDPIDARAADIAKQEGRDKISDDDRKRAFEEMQRMAPAPESSPPEPSNS